MQQFVLLDGVLPGLTTFRRSVCEAVSKALRPSSVAVAMLAVGGQLLVAQQVPLVRPGAPGQPNTVVQNPVGTAVKEPTAADLAFMRDMIMHHSQAVEMVNLMKGRTTNPETLEMGRRISISQGDEIAFMKRWLAFFGKPAQADGSMAGMDHSTMDMPMDTDMPPMPGMLSPRQMAALRSAKGNAFDHLFLTGMIQHHTGALSMVKELFDTGNGGQEPQLFDFTADVDVTQRAEIQVMQGMLAKEKK